MEKIKHIQKTLTPIILQEGMPGFETVQDIEEKLNELDVFNIAITGPYGSGKRYLASTQRCHVPVPRQQRTTDTWHEQTSLPSHITAN